LLGCTAIIDFEGISADETKPAPLGLHDVARAFRPQRARIRKNSDFVPESLVNERQSRQNEQRSAQNGRVTSA